MISHVQLLNAKYSDDSPFKKELEALLEQAKDVRAHITVQRSTPPVEAKANKAKEQKKRLRSNGQPMLLTEPDIIAGLAEQATKPSAPNAPHGTKRIAPAKSKPGPKPKRVNATLAPQAAPAPSLPAAALSVLPPNLPPAAIQHLRILTLEEAQRLCRPIRMVSQTTFGNHVLAQAGALNAPAPMQQGEAWPKASFLAPLYHLHKFCGFVCVRKLP